MINFASRVTDSLSELGVQRSMQTLLSMVEDTVFDLRMGIDTRTAVAQSELTVISPENQSAANPYVMTRSRALRHAFRVSGVPRDFCFNDIGCGKGRVVVVAALSGFKQVRGLDFAPELIDIAERNIRKLKSRLPQDSKITVERADVTTCDYGPEDCVFFLYNPFSADVMRKFCERLRNSLDEFPRKIWVIYADPAQLPTMLQHLPVEEVKRSVYGGFEFAYLESTLRNASINP